MSSLARPEFPPRSVRPRFPRDTRPFAPVGRLWRSTLPLFLPDDLSMRMDERSLRLLPPILRDKHYGAGPPALRFS
jgi:hypothetical protein